MKFNDYLNKELSPRSVPQGITVRDENREQQLEAQIAGMSAQLSSLQDNVKELESLKMTLKNTKADYIQERAGRLLAEQEVERATYQLDVQRKFETEIKSLSARATSFQDIIQSVKIELVDKERVNNKQQDDLFSLTATNGILQTSQEDLVRKVRLGEQKLEFVNHAKDGISDMLRKEQDKYDILDTENKKLKNEYDQIIARNDYLNVAYARFEEELAMERERVKNLSESLELVQTSYNTNQHYLKDSSVEVNDLQTQVSSLLKTLTDSNDHNNYLLDKQEYLEAVLAKPKYTSLASIARTEGFKMPLGGMASNARKNYLGTGKPTLLKFQTKEPTNDDTE